MGCSLFQLGLIGFITTLTQSVAAIQMILKFEFAQFLSNRYIFEANIVR